MRLSEKRPEAWKSNQWMFHTDNASGHTSLLIWSVFGKNKATAIPHPPYSTSLTQVDFPKMLKVDIFSHLI